jgi:hypothetical protein
MEFFRVIGSQTGGRWETGWHEVTGSQTCCRRVRGRIIEG